MRTAGQGGLLLGASGSQLLLDGVPLESTQAERSFADLLNAAGVASICFLPSVEREEFANLVKAFMESSGPKAGPLTERLGSISANAIERGNSRERDSICGRGCGLLRGARCGATDGKNAGRGRRDGAGLVSQPRENDSADRRGRRRTWRQRRNRDRHRTPASRAPARAAAARIRQRLRHRSGSGTYRRRDRVGQARAADLPRGASSVDPKDLPQLGEADMQSLLRLLAQFGEAAHGGTKGGPSARPGGVAAEVRFAARRTRR